MQFTHKFTFMVPLDGHPGWTISDLDGEADCVPFGFGWRVMALRVYATKVIAGDAITKLLPIDIKSQLGNEIWTWLMTTQSNQIRASWDEATEHVVPDRRDSYEHEHRQTQAMVL